MSKVTQKQMELAKEIEKLFNKTIVCDAYAIFIGLICKSDEHATQMIEFIKNNPNLKEQDYVNKAKEISGFVEQEFIIED